MNLRSSCPYPTPSSTNQDRSNPFLYILLNGVANLILGLPYEAVPHTLRYLFNVWNSHSENGTVKMPTVAQARRVMMTFFNLWHAKMKWFKTHRCTADEVEEWVNLIVHTSRDVFQKGAPTAQLIAWYATMGLL